jgi:hypothetical protein
MILNRVCDVIVDVFRTGGNKINPGGIKVKVTSYVTSMTAGRGQEGVTIHDRYGNCKHDDLF